ncbi:MAG: GDSL-type esterase/lipase family protein [Acholeplasmataceae bacterium]|jgi:lysophospholipase L1-like esterase|nr:GDSL-type esterase/lipase family protein [Acholeplasmataceae bacterium]
MPKMFDLQKLIDLDYERKVSTFRALPITGKDIILGDSMISLLNLRKYDLGDWINMGIAGDTTEGVMNRLDAVHRQKPKRVILNIGSNDLVRLNRSPNEIILAITSIVQSLALHAKVWVLTLTPINDQLDLSNHTYIAGRKNADILDINQKLKETSLNIIDTATPLMDSSLSLHENLTSDGIHLNDRGYQIFIQTLKTSLKIQ